MATEALGRRLLGEVGVSSLEDVLTELRTQHSKSVNAGQSRLGIPQLDDVWNRHGGRLELTGRSLPLLYHVVSTAVSAPRLGTVVVVDIDGKFDVSRLSCSIEDLKHVHVFRPGKEAVKVTLDSIEPYLLYGSHFSQGRDLVATIVIGGNGGDITAGWRGWLRIDSEKEEVMRFGMGMSVEEALREREARQSIIDEKGWTGVSERGVFRWVEHE